MQHFHVTAFVGVLSSPSDRISGVCCVRVTDCSGSYTANVVSGEHCGRLQKSIVVRQCQLDRPVVMQTSVSEPSDVAQ